MALLDRLHNPAPARRRFRVVARFGQAPRFVLASSQLYARLIAWRLAAA